MKHIIYAVCLSVLLTFQLVGSGIAATGISYKYPKNNKVLFYAPGYYTSHNGPQNALLDDGEKLFQNATHFAFAPTQKADEDATLDMVTSFGEYGTVIIHTHGWFKNNAAGFRTGTVTTNTLDVLYETQLKNKWLRHSKGADLLDDHQYVVFPKYIKKYVPDNSLEGVFFWLAYCHSLQNDKMWNALKAKGAKVAFGFNEEYIRPFGVAMYSQGNKEGDPIGPITDGIMYRMLPNDPAIHPKTAREAFDAMSDEDKTDTDHRDAKFVMRPEDPADEWNNFVFDELKVYLRLTIDGHKLVRGGQILELVYCNREGQEVRIENSVRGNSLNSEDDKYFYAGLSDVNYFVRFATITLSGFSP